MALRSGSVTMLPRPEVSETGFALADPGNAYVILQPSETGDPISMTLTPAGTRSKSGTA